MKLSLGFLKTKAYWWRVFKMGALFILIITILQFAISFLRLDFNTFLQINFGDGKWKFFLLSRLLGGLFYGMWMVNWKYRKELKTKQ